MTPQPEVRQAPPRRNDDELWSKHAARADLSRMLAQMQRYWQWADAHWTKVKDLWADGASDDVKREILEGGSYFAAAFRVEGDSRHRARLQQNHVRELQEAFRSFPELVRPPHLPDAMRRTFETQRIECDMNVRLALWLCTYFLGIPYCDVWEDIALMQRRLGAFPGGAFYDKMAGDIYRMERRQYLKRLKGGRPCDDQHEVLVMAYTPLLLIPDESDLTYISRRENGSGDVYLSPEELHFLGCVEKLACCYLRYQAWRFFQDPARPKIKYAVSQLSLVTAMTELADFRLLERTHPAAADYESARAEWTRKSEAERKIARRSAEWKEQFAQLLRDSDTRLNYFMGANNSRWELAIFADEATKRRGLTSCILGRADGVITNRPNRTDQATAFCSWTEGIVLDEEKEKLRRLWAAAAASGSGNKNIIVYRNTKNFSAEWSNLSERERSERTSDEDQLRQMQPAEIQRAGPPPHRPDDGLSPTVAKSDDAGTNAAPQETDSAGRQLKTVTSGQEAPPVSVRPSRPHVPRDREWRTDS